MRLYLFFSKFLIFKAYPSIAEFLKEGIFIDDFIFLEAILPRESIILMVSLLFIVFIDLSIFLIAVISSSADGSKSLTQLFLISLCMCLFTISFKS